MATRSALLLALLAPACDAFVAPLHGARARALGAPVATFAPRKAATLDQSSVKPPLAPQDEWIGKLDLAGFRNEIRDLGNRLEKQQGEADVKHIKKICFMANTCAAVGLASMWMNPNPITVMALSLWTFSRWTTIAHHTCHGGYNKADPTRFFNSKGFALGSLQKRVGQWFDWMLPEAWNVEHNNLHHYRLGELDDPDLVERNLEFVRELKVPRVFKYGAVAFLMCTWKWFYYAPNTYKELVIAEMRRKGEVITPEMGAKEAFTLKYFLEPASMRKTHKWYRFRDFFSKVIGPYLVGHFFLLPLPVAAAGAAVGGGAVAAAWYTNAVLNLLLADVVTNIHAFITIATNHAGDDLYQFGSSCAPNSGTFYLRQVISSANFKTGGDANDFMHGWLNYQVEHHLWPQLSALSYQKAQPEVAAICGKYGVPYVQQSVWWRLKKTVDIMVGKASMRVFPEEYVEEKDRMVWNDQKEMENAQACVENTPAKDLR